MPATPNENPRVLKTEYRSDDTPPAANAAPVVTEAVKLTLKPGDVLVLRIDTPALSKDARDCVKGWLAEHLPSGIHTLVLSNRESLQVVQRESTTGDG